jgi:hypothetical protein
MNDAYQDYAIACSKILLTTPIFGKILSTIAY